MIPAQFAIPGTGRIIPLHPAIPRRWRRALSGRSVISARLPVVKCPPPVKVRMRRPEKIRVSDHAALYRMVTDGAHVGPWRHEYAPHTVKIMDAFGQPWVREIWFCGVEQSGKTNTMLNCMAWAIDCDPGNIFYLMPTEATSDKVTGEKIRPMLVASSRLARYLAIRQDDTTLARIKLRHGVTLWPAHANSASSMASWAAKHCFGDEVDKYPAMTGKEASPIDLIKKRNRTYRGRYKRFFASTPAGLHIHQGMMACQQVWEYRLRCPHCSELIRPVAEHLALPADETAEAIEAEGCALACHSCGTHLAERDREQAIRRGAWHCIKGAEISRPSRIGFHHRAWDCLDIPLAEIAVAWIQAKTGGTAEKVAWANGYEAINYEPEHRERDEDRILLLRDDRPDGIVPTWADALEISIDTQDNGFWYRIRAWEFGTMQSALVRCGFIEDFAGLDRLIYDSTWPDAAGNQHRIMAGIIDSAGHRTAEVYEWCRRPGSIVLASKGAQRRKSVPVTVGKIDHYPGTSKAIPGGLRLYHLDTHFHKDELARKLDIHPGDPGCFWLHSGHTAGQLADLARFPADEKPPHNLKEYARQMCSEHRDERGLWQHDGKKPNHLWDCESGGLALALYLGFQHRQKPGADPGNERKKPATPGPKNSRW